MTFVDNSIHAVNPTAAGAAPTAATALPDEGGITFDDLVDIVNPLQHIPVVSTIYRAITGDQIKTFPKIAGDTLYGGVTGFAGSMADTIFQKITGKSFGDTVLAEVEDLFSPSTSTASPTAVASAAPATKNFGERLIDGIESLFSSSDSSAPPAAIAIAAPTTATPATATPGTAAPTSAVLATATLATAAPTPLRAPPIDTTATPVPSNVPALSAPSTVAPAALDAIVVPGQDALLSALSRNGVSPDTASRAAEAYRRSLSVVPNPGARPQPAPSANIMQ